MKPALPIMSWFSFCSMSKLACPSMLVSLMRAHTAAAPPLKPRPGIQLDPTEIKPRERASCPAKNSAESNLACPGWSLLD